MAESQITKPTPAYVSKNPRPGFRECIDLFCHAYDAWGTHYHEDVSAMTDRTDTTARISACEEAMGHTVAIYGPLNKREVEIAESAARSAYRWALREVIEDLREKVEGAA